jgi:hypothetical protein
MWSCDLFSLEVDLVLLNTTSTYFEKQGCIVGIPLGRWEVADEVLKRTGRCHKVADNLEVLW